MPMGLYSAGSHRRTYSCFYYLSVIAARCLLESPVALESHIRAYSEAWLTSCLEVRRLALFSTWFKVSLQVQQLEIGLEKCTLQKVWSLPPDAFG